MFSKTFFQIQIYIIFQKLLLKMSLRTIAGLTFEIEEWAALCQLIGMPATLRHGQHKFANKFILL